MHKLTSCLVIIALFTACHNRNTILDYGQHYQQYKDYESLNKVVMMIAPDADTAYIKKILGNPIDMGFDYRYMVDSTGINGCSIGAVFNIAANGKTDQKWIGEICE